MSRNYRVSIESIQHWRVMLSDDYGSAKTFALFTSLKRKDVRIPQYIMKHYEYVVFDVSDKDLWEYITTGKKVKLGDEELLVIAIEKIPGDPTLLN